MNESHPARRGQPLLFVGALLLGWLAVRALTWESPIMLEPAVQRTQGPADTTMPSSTALDSGHQAEFPEQGEEAPSGGEGGTFDPGEQWRAPGRPLPGLMPSPLPYGVREPLAGGVAQDEGFVTAGMAVGHALLSMLGLSQLHLPAALASLLDPDPQPATPPATVPAPRPSSPRLAQRLDAAPQPGAPVSPAPSSPDRAARWSADGWLVLRNGNARASAAEEPSYGRSQAGAVLRYRLSPASRHAPQAYVRASSALRSPRDAELAGGFSARPLPDLPVRLAAEVRVVDAQGGTDIRPAAYAVSELPPFNLPLGARGEAYVQGGYVGGDFATPFIDGQLRVVRDVARIGGSTLSLGGGAWGGAQEDAARLDVGPGAALSFGIGQVYSRLSLDYRLRVAGDAEPRSGPTLTLSAGF